MGLRNRKEVGGEEAEIEMTPMIDVVFQLLIYFLVTMKPVDVVAHLDVFRPSPDSAPKEQTEPPKMIRVNVYKDGYTINDRAVPLSELERLLFKLAAIDQSQTIMITCTSDSPHMYLIKVLDLCSKAGLTNLSVVSAN